MWHLSPCGHLQSQYVSRLALLLEPPSAYLDTDGAKYTAIRGALYHSTLPTTPQEMKTDILGPVS